MKFALIGAAGYVAPKHIQAIKDIGGELVAILDPSDSVGIIDSYFPNCKYFGELERFWRQLDKWGDIDYVSICSPNYLHDAHCMMGMNIGADIICEKPLVIKPHNLERLEVLEQKYNKKIYNVLQLRYNSEVLEYKKNITEFFPSDHFYDVYITYNTPRGEWYKRSWKGDEKKSGGILYNIGIHLFDLVYFLFGEYVDFNINKYESNHAAYGTLTTKMSEVIWYLNINKYKKPERQIIINDTELKLDNNFGNLHTTVYEEILKGNGYGIKDIKPTIEMIDKMKTEYNER
jgi:UDP-N-acetyl-2-amino-2-deoxyglucuronate dehydrogenase